MRIFKRTQIAAMVRLSGSLTALASLATAIGHGYFWAGYQQTGIDKILFTTNTISPISAVLNEARYHASSLRSLIKGYIRGGFNYFSNRLASTEAVTFSTDTQSGISASLSQARNGASGASSSVAGYSVAGQTDAAPGKRIDKIVFSTDTNSNLGDLLASAEVNFGAVSSPTNGYFVGGNMSASTGVSLSFASDTLVTKNGLLSLVRYNTGEAESLYKGYFFGGATAAGDVLSNKIDGLTFSTETATTLSALLSRASSDIISLSSSSAGYAGFSNKTIDSLAFSTETLGVVSGTLSFPRSAATGIGYVPGPQGAKGYVAGGMTASAVSTIVDGIIFSSDTTFMASARLSSAIYGAAGTYSAVAGYLAGGGLTAGTTNMIQKLTFGVETSSELSATLDMIRVYSAGWQTLSTGYIVGGTTFPGNTNLSTIMKLAFVSDTTVLSSSSLPATRREAGSCSSETTGYVACGYNGTYMGSLSGKIFATDTSQSISGGLAVARKGVAGVNDSNLGYFGGGEDSSLVKRSNIDMLTFATNSRSDSTSALAIARDRLASANSSSAGYFLGGYKSSSIPVDIVDKIVLTTGVINTSTAKLSIPRYYVTGLSYTG